VGKKDRLREIIELAQEAYILSTHPPAIDYTKNIDPTYHDDLIKRSGRAFLLRFSIDAKYTAKAYLESIPRKRAEVLVNWLQDGSKHAEYKLSYKKRKLLKIDRIGLKDAIMPKK
jgi:predicted HD phosphohydrolase